MEFTVKKFDILQELTLIQGVVERKTTIPILANVLLRASENELGIAATDLEIGLTSVCPSKVTVPGSVTLPAKRLFEIVRALPDQDIRFKKADNNWMLVQCGPSRFRIAGLPQEDFPQQATPKETLAELPAAVLAKFINRTIFAISAEDSKYTLCGALLVIRPRSVTMVATDGHRLAQVEKEEIFDEVNEEIKVLIPRKAMAELTRILGECGEDEKIAFSKDDNHLFFHAGKRLLVSRILSGQFPNYEAVIPRGNERTVAVAREEITAAVRRVAILADERSKAVKVALSEGKLEVAASHSELGEASEVLEVEYAKEPTEVGFNYQYLLDFLTNADEPEISFEFKDGESAAQIRALPAGDYNYRYIVMPMRI